MNKYIVHRSETPYMANPLPLYIFFSTPPPPKKKKNIGPMYYGIYTKISSWKKLPLHV